MATQNIIQYLETSQYNALPSGGTVAVGVEAMNRRQIETFIASEAISAQDVVAFDITKTADGDKMIHVVKADGNDTDRVAVVGVALEAAAASGDTIDVCIAGLCQAKTDGSVAKGDRLIADAATPGAFHTADAADVLPIIAYATADDSGTVATVIVIKQF
jgi:hypothetical protein